MIESRINLIGCFVSLIVLIVSLSVTGCTNAATQERERQETMRKFVTGAIEHMLDRNPDTIQQSMTLLTRDEMTQPLVDKLVQQKLLPETDLSVLKIKDEAQQSHTTNQVVVSSAAPVDSTNQPEIRFKVAGKEISQKGGATTNSRDFEYFVTCKLTPEMAGFPRITALAPVTEMSSTQSAEAETAEHSEHQHKKHKHHHGE
jgi:hypothetical protein